MPTSSIFQIDEHVVESQYIRQYPGASREQENLLKLHVKQYIPKDNPSPKPGDATIIALHANGFVKELYEPLFEDIVRTANGKGLKIRSIWIPDVAQQGFSAVLNENELGNDASYFDLSRDVLHMINMFREQMPRPILGIGHSMGGSTLGFLSFIHPRLFTSIVLIDPPIFGGTTKMGTNVLKFASLKRDFWSSRHEAEAWVRRNVVYKSWDSRVIDRLLKFGFRDTPTLLYPRKGVTWTTPKHQEAFMLSRPNFRKLGRESLSIDDRQSVPDLDLEGNVGTFFYKPEPRETMRLLPYLRPSILYIQGSQASFLSSEQRSTRTSTTGTGPGGSGGATLGRVSEVLIEGAGHLVPFEKVGDTANVIVEFFTREISEWTVREREWQDLWARKSTLEKQTMDDEWISNVKSVTDMSKTRRAKL